jgi:hypothetical protein
VRLTDHVDEHKLISYIRIQERPLRSGTSSILIYPARIRVPSLCECYRSFSAWGYTLNKGNRVCWDGREFLPGQNPGMQENLPGPVNYTHFAVSTSKFPATRDAQSMCVIQIPPSVVTEEMVLEMLGISETHRMLSYLGNTATR